MKYFNYLIFIKKIF